MFDTKKKKRAFQKFKKKLKGFSKGSSSAVKLSTKSTVVCNPHSSSLADLPSPGAESSSSFGSPGTPPPPQEEGVESSSLFGTPKSPPQRSPLSNNELYDDELYGVDLDTFRFELDTVNKFELENGSLLSDRELINFLKDVVQNLLRK